MSNELAERFVALASSARVVRPRDGGRGSATRSRCGAVAAQRARRRLDEEFGLTPGPALQALQARVLTHDPALDHAPMSTALLLVAAGSRQERIVHLDARRQLTLGRDAGNDVELHWDGRVSRVHALLECIRGAWMLADDGLSSNGTFCNDRRVRRRRLKDGDVLRLGSTTLVFRDPNDRPRDRTAVEP